MNKQQIAAIHEHTHKQLVLLLTRHNLYLDHASKSLRLYEYKNDQMQYRIRLYYHNKYLAIVHIQDTKAHTFEHSITPISYANPNYFAEIETEINTIISLHH